MAKELKEILDICIITYNRASHLERTLHWIVSSDLSNAKITILDNCSTDSTPTVCEKYKAINSNINIIRNMVNLGALGNIIKALQLASLEYIWVLCDDDILMLNDCDDLVNELHNGTSDIIFTGTSRGLSLKYGMRSRLDELFESEPWLLKVMAFLPSTIYRTSLIDSNFMQQYFWTCRNLFGHLAIASPLLSKGIRVYALKKPLVRQDQADAYPWTSIEIASNYIQTCMRLLSDHSHRSRAIYEVPSRIKTSGPFGFLLRIASTIVVSKAQRRFTRSSEFLYRETIFESFCQIFLGSLREQRLLVALCTPLLFIPECVCFHVIRVFLWIAYSSRGKPVPSWIPGESIVERIP